MFVFFFSVSLQHILVALNNRIDIFDVRQQYTQLTKRSRDSLQTKKNNRDHGVTVTNKLGHAGL
jgi:hypothetical protein